MTRQKDKQRLSKIINYCGLILDSTLNAGLGYEKILIKLSEDFVFQTSTSMILIQIGEMARNLSDELKGLHTEIPWKTISGLRNRLVHDYEETNWSVIAGVIEDDVQPLLNACSEILARLEEE